MYIPGINFKGSLFDFPSSYQNDKTTQFILGFIAGRVKSRNLVLDPPISSNLIRKK